ncbi:sigma-70 family RNA polymerase sigma factor [Nocardioides sp. WS12]|uniref:RNA polymerase sigma factor n=1 Tax=Nocardioides sp. WS12 TaxID=2486272 RepID=UPI0015F814AC|nr:sigma-70 family RNA polymerase sigma factor [Nocardioides sp. WS12]
MIRPFPTPLDSRDHSTTDADLLDRVRNGDTQAYADLYDRHRQAALRVAIAASGPSRAEDLVAEVFTRTLQLLISGSGPDRAFRAYLFTAIRNLNVNVHSKERRSLPVGDLTALDHTLPDAPPSATPTHDLAAEAFRALPARWREVLWLTTVEGRSLNEVAALVGSNPNAVAQLAFRAREALRRAYFARLAGIPHRETCPAEAIVASRQIAA